MTLTHALIFAAGKGDRMRPLTDHTPKPLLKVADKPLIVWHLEKLRAIGVRNVVINTSHLSEQFPATLGDGSRWELVIHYRYEGTEPLETGGGMLNALPLLGHAPFLVVNGDIWCDLDFSTLPQEPDALAHLIVTNNPSHNPDGDFVLRDGRLFDEPAPRSTFAGIGVYRPELLAALEPGKYSIVPTLRKAMRAGQVSGALFQGAWWDVGTPQRLAQLDAYLRKKGMQSH